MAPNPKTELGLEICLHIKYVSQNESKHSGLGFSGDQDLLFLDITREKKNNKTEEKVSETSLKFKLMS